MTREEAIEYLDGMKIVIPICNELKELTDERNEVIDMAIEALSADAVEIHNDGTLEVKVPNAHKVGRVLVMDTDSHIGGGLFYPDDAVQGEWILVNGDGSLWRCDQCNDTACCKGNYCPSCGSRMKGGAE